MIDPIERQAAIDALKEHRALFCDNTPDTFSKLSYGEKCRVDELDTAISTLVNLPSAQPESCVDVVSRTDVFNAVRGEERGGYVDETVECMLKVMSDLPPVTPEQKTGKWECGDDMFEYAICSSCKWDSGEAWEYALKHFKFCPNCGAKMKEGDQK